MQRILSVSQTIALRSVVSESSRLSEHAERLEARIEELEAQLANTEAKREAQESGYLRELAEEFGPGFESLPRSLEALTIGVVGEGSETRSVVSWEPVEQEPAEPEFAETAEE